MMVALGLAAVGCGSDPIDRSLARSDESINILCACPEAVGGTTEAACRTTLESYQLTDTQIACVRQAYSTHSAELGPSLDCQDNAVVAQHDCMRRALAVCPPSDPAALAACNTAFGEAAARCPSPSTAAQNAFSACFPSGD